MLRTASVAPPAPRSKASPASAATLPALAVALALACATPAAAAAAGGLPAGLEARAVDAAPVAAGVAPLARLPARVAEAGRALPAEWRDAEARRSEALTLDRAVELAQRRYNARVVRAEERREGDEVVYRIRLLSAEGKVFTVTVDARTGRMD